jgi:hypothetical protein
MVQYASDAARQFRGSKRMSEASSSNDQFSSVYANGVPQIDWVKIQEIERDICLLYHQLSSYPHVTSDLYFGDVFKLPYWNFLDIQGLDGDQRKFIRRGSLVFIYAMVSEEAGGSGAYLSFEGGRLSACRRKIEACKPEDEDERLLLESIKSGFEIIENGKIGDASIYGNSAEIHKRFVRRYFTKIAEAFK